MVEETTNEIWKDIPGYENFYQISTMGRVKSMERKVKGKKGSIYTVREKILKSCKNTGGYLYVILKKEGKLQNARIHRLVADAFLPNPNNFPEINHINEIKEDNRLENLEWCSHIYNMNFGSRNERSRKSNINNPKRSKKIICIETGKIYPSANEVQRQLGFAQSHISDCCNGKYKQSYGYHWQYVEQ